MDRKRAVIYCRVSTDKQEVDGESLEYQESKCRQYAELHDLDVVVVLLEAKSGFIHYSHREKLTLARQMIRDHLAEVIIVFDLRRFSRNFVHSAMIFEEIESNGGQIVSVSENIDNSLTGKLIRSILAWNAESEREKIVEYANRRWQSRLELGLPVGTGYSPYGWDWGDKEKTYYVINPEEAAVRFSIFHMYVELDMSLRSIAHKLTEDGIPSPLQTRYPGSNRGQFWTFTTLYDFIKNPVNIGVLMIAKKQHTTDGQGRARRQPNPNTKIIPNGLPAIIPIGLYERAQQKLASNQVEQSHQPRDPSLHLLRGHVRCATCGQRLNTRILHRRKHDYPYYYCANKRNRFSRCPDIPIVRADFLDELVWAQCCRVFERIEAIQAKIEAEITQSLHQLLEDTHGRQQITDLETTIAYAYQERAKHQEGSYYYQLITQDIQAKSEQLRRYEAEVASSRDLGSITASYRQRALNFFEFLNVMRGRYQEATFQEKRNALDVLGVSVIYSSRSAEEKHRGIDVTLEEVRERTSITYSPLFTGVQTPVHDRS
jgi:site-specific DNA recombinase